MRKTNQRTIIEQVIIQKGRPLTVEEILTSGREQLDSLNQATVYRNLKLLVENGWLRKLNHPVLGALYERTDRGHHHHFHCRVCDRVFELPGCALDEEKAVPSGFVAEGHELFLFGVCPSCIG
jgi:Fur family ferric uptake transcriptional regulator